MSQATTASVGNSIQDVGQLEDLLSEPSEGVIETFRRLEGDLILLGVGGKMGPSLARMARRASDAAGIRRQVIGVSRFSNTQVESFLNAHGVQTLRSDLLDQTQLDRLPHAPNVVFMTGMKFGSTGQEGLTWAMNTLLPAMVCKKYRRSRIVAFSTGNVYGLSPVASGGSSESDELRPTGDYAMSCVGRERIFEYFSRIFNAPVAILRLNYATELRYGVLVDLARRVFAGEPIDLTMGYFNAIWQGDANAMALQAFAHVAAPSRILNIARPELLSVRHVAEQFSQLLNKKVTFQGTEAANAFLSNAQKALGLFGCPRVNAPQMMEWIADWVRRGGEHLGKPTHFQVRDGKF